MANDINKLDRRTRAVHAGIRRSQYGEVSEAIFLTQGFTYESAEVAEARFQHSGPDEFTYARAGNPTTRMFEERMAAIEGAEAGFATGSGMAAVNGALMSMLRAGDRVVAARALFGSCIYILQDILGRFGVEVVLVDGTDLAQWKAAVTPVTKAVFFESISNPTLEVIDVAAVAQIAHAAGALVVIDNVFATPVFSRAVELGADVVVYSTTKHVDGGGRALGGIVLGSAEYIADTLGPYMRHTGAAMSPFTAWMMLKGLESMDLRVRAQAESALAIAQALEGREGITRVLFPGLPSHPGHPLAIEQYGSGGTVLSFDLGSQDAAFRFMDALDLILISNNLGDAKSIITHPATTTHQRLDLAQKDRLGITPGLVRLSVGLEAVDDLLADITQALATA